MIDFTREQLEQMDLETAKVEIGNAVYESSRLFDQLEYANHKIRGNGHHIRQKLSAYAQELMVERWEGE